MTEDEMVGWHHRLNGHEFEQALGDEGQGSLARVNFLGILSHEAFCSSSPNLSPQQTHKECLLKIPKLHPGELD